MKVAQLLATIPDALPPEYADRADQAAEPGAADGLGLRQAAHAGRARRRTGRRSSTSFEHQPAAAASLGQVHRARAHDGARAGLQAAISRHAVGGRSRPAASSSCCSRSAGASIRRSTPPRSPRRSARACARSSTTCARPSTSRSTRHARRTSRPIRVPEVVAGAVDRPAADARLARGRAAARATRTTRSPCATGSPPRCSRAWWLPFSRYGVIHGDPHLGNYTVFDEKRRAGRHQSARLRLHPHLPAELRRRRGRSLPRPAATATTRCVVHAYETWGFKRLNRELIDMLNIWARFIYGPLLDDRVRTIADGVKPSRIRPPRGLPVHQALKAKGPVTVPREFVFMDRAAIGLGARVPASARRAQFLPAVQRGDRGLLGRAGRRAASAPRWRRPGSTAVATSAALTSRERAGRCPCRPQLR